MKTRLHEVVSEACRPIGPYWPMKTFAYYNPIRDLEHLPFVQALRDAEHLTGGRGFLANEEYRRLFCQGRITRTSLRRALVQAGPRPPDPDTVRVGGRLIHAGDVWELHAVYGIDALPPALLTWAVDSNEATSRFRTDLPDAIRQSIVARTIKECEHCRDDPEGAYLRNLWNSALFACHVSEAPEDVSFVSDFDPEELSHSAGSHEVQGSPDLPRFRTVGDWLDDVMHSSVIDTINSQMIKWVAAFVDEGIAAWDMPGRERGFYSSWQEMAQNDCSLALLEVPQIRQHIGGLPQDPEESLLRHLLQLDIPEDRWVEYLSRHLAQLPGWAGFIRWRGNNPGYPAQHQYPIDALQYLAVRVFYEAELVEAVCRQQLGISGNLGALRTHEAFSLKAGEDVKAEFSHPLHASTQTICENVWRTFHLAQFLELAPIDVHEASAMEIQRMLAWLDLFPSPAHGPVWLEAYEDGFRDHLLTTITKNQSSTKEGKTRPRAQAIFCIDARSEPFRRHLEAQGPYETFGYAGFFGVPMGHVAFDSHDHLALCPILLTPKSEVIEVSRTGQEDRLQTYAAGTRWQRFGTHLFHELKQNPIVSFMLIDVLGVFFSIGLTGKTVCRTLFESIRSGLCKRLGKSVATQIPVGPPNERQEGGTDPGHLIRGFTIQEQAAFVEGGLRIIGLVENFGRFVMVCGHGSRSDNNPYFAALDCGACGGSHGDPNARVFSAMANHPDVRRILKEHGLSIPEDTWFLPAKHNTTTDRVEFYDTIEMPPAFKAEWNLLVQDLEEAGRHQALERCRRIPGTPTHLDPGEAFAHVRSRSMDWANPRPEWGLSGNAAFLIGRRALTKGVTLEGRVFLHSYDPAPDPDGSLLEKIMTAPLIVGELISLTYYFSAVDPWSYGSGSKVIHNIVAGIGVMLGSQSDLQKGLPLQSVNDGARHFHEPIRLLAIIEAPPERIQAIIQKHTLLKHLFHNQWMHLIALDPVAQSYSRYLTNGSWEPFSCVS